MVKVLKKPAEGVYESYRVFEDFVDSLGLGRREPFDYSGEYRTYHLETLGLTLGASIRDGDFVLKVAGQNERFFLKRFQEAQEREAEDGELEELAEQVCSD